MRSRLCSAEQEPSDDLIAFIPENGWLGKIALACETELQSFPSMTQVCVRFKAKCNNAQAFPLPDEPNEMEQGEWC